MKYAVLIFLLIVIPATLAQQPKPKGTPPKKATATKPKPKASPPKKTTAASKPKPAPVPTPTPLSEKEQFDKASAHELAVDRVTALEKFLKDFPESKDRQAALELLTSSRVLIAEEKLLAGDPVDAVLMFKRVVSEAPQPIPDELFAEAIAKIPSTLFRRGQRESAFEIAEMIENKVEGSTPQLLEVANFYLSVENGSTAMRVVARAAAKDPTSAAVYRTLAQTHRINFDLDGAAGAYAKALELEPDSYSSKRGLAEMKRAIGKPAEAVILYRELLAKNGADVPAQTGLILALFDAGKRTEAETELTRVIEKTPGNVVLLAGAAYWYAANGSGQRAVELAQKALDREPRYIWSHIALARGLILQGKPVAAEQALVKARAYGNFPTLEYELASARAAAGFYREAAEDLSKHFTVSDGAVRTRLGGRVARDEKSLADLVAYERRASIFAADAADSPENAEILRSLLDFHQKAQAASPNEAEITAAADSFVKGSDKMKLHRQLYAAALLLEKRTAFATVLELTKAATGNTDAALEVADPGAAVMASELYESRATAFRAKDFLLVPVVPKPTLSAILRGRIEEITGWTLYQQNNFPDAIVRLRRAVGVMPDKSAWWRSSMWRLGAALAADGKDTEALNSYIESYKTDKPDFGKYAVVETLYRKVNGSTDGLEAKIGAQRVAVIGTEETASPSPAPPAASTNTSLANVPIATDAPKADDKKVEPIIEQSKPEEKKIDPSVFQPRVEEKKVEPVVEQPKLEEKKIEPVIDQPRPEEKKIEPVIDPPKPEEKKIEPIVDPPKPEEKKTEPVVDPPKPEEKKIEPVIETPKPEEKKSNPVTRPDPIVEKVESKPPPVVENKSDRVKPAIESTPTERKADAGTETKPVVIITDTTKETVKPATPIETNTIEKKNDPGGEKQPPQNPVDESIVGHTRPTTPKPLFDPIIITIPNSRPKKVDTSNTATDKTDDQKAKDSDAAISSGAARQRVIDEREVTATEIPPCAITLSQDTVSVINGGGKVGILVGVEGPGDIKSLTGVSSSPKDLQVTMEPEIVGLPDKRFFVIKSISSSLGVYQITFAVPCGKKDLIVSTR